jgi:hypothetical protein
VSTEAALAGRYDLDTIRAAWWTARALRRARRSLQRNGLAATVPPPPELPWGARRGVLAILRRVDHTCLERAVVLQRWLAAHDRPHDVIIGVARPDDGFAAHAWLDFENASQPYAEVHRLPPPA